MFLHVHDGLWLGTQDIVLTVILLVGVVFGFGWWWGRKRADSYRLRWNCLVYGVANPSPRKNVLHYLGDIWNYLFANE
jgi:hypothetical protein